MANGTIGRIPPNNIDAEIALLGAVLLRNKVLDENKVNSLVKEDFYQRGHQLIWDGIIGLRNDKPSVAIDIVSLTQYMTEKGTVSECGGSAYIASLTDSVPSAANASYYAEIIKNCSLKRKLLDISVYIGDKAFDDTQEVKTAIDEVEQRVSAMGSSVTVNNYSESGPMLKVLVDDIIQGNKKKLGLSSGFKSLDSYIGGFKPSDMVIIAARPSVGKTALGLAIAINMAFTNNIPVAFFSLEMSGPSLLERVLSNRAQINNTALRNGQLPASVKAHMLDVVEPLYDRCKNFLIQDTPNISLMEIRSQARRMKREKNIQAIFIDYIGLIDLQGPSNMPRHEQVSIISRSIKSLARELEVPIICLAQVNREGGKDRPPMLADLRDSGSIEQDADLVILLDDPSKRLNEEGKIEQYEESDAEEANEVEEKTSIAPSSKNKKLKIIIAKQRNGRTGAFNLNFVADYMTFREIDKNWMNEPS